MRGMWRVEQELHDRGFLYIAGVDEAGRGPLAGPVVAAAVIFPPRYRLQGVADSKTLIASRRERLCDLIHKHAVAIGIGISSAQTIDKMNVLEATHLAMQEAIGQLHIRPEILLVDGRRLPKATLPQRAIVGGDKTCGSIAAASIVAKVVRDRIMIEIDARYPSYGFARHKGYATQEHLARLQEMGACPEHRTSFAPVRMLLQCALSLNG